MKRKGIAFMDDLIDNLITFLLIIIVFVMIFFVTSAAQKKTERTYEETSKELNDQELLTDLLRQPTATGETIQELLQSPRNEVKKKSAEEAITYYFDNAYGKKSWYVTILYPNDLTYEYGSTLAASMAIQTQTDITGTSFSFGDLAAAYLPTTEGQAAITVQGVKKGT